MVKLIFLSAVFLAVVVIARPQVEAEPTVVTMAVSTTEAGVVGTPSETATPGPESPDTETPDDPNIVSKLPGVGAIVNAYNNAGVIQEVIPMIPNVCYKMPYAKAMLTYNRNLLLKVKAYKPENGGTECKCLGLPSPSIFLTERCVEYSVPNGYKCIRLQ